MTKVNKQVNNSASGAMNRVSITPLIACQWGQGSPYYKNSVNLYSDNYDI